jgi:hypothetical protein
LDSTWQLELSYIQELRESKKATGEDGRIAIIKALKKENQ